MTELKPDLQNRAADKRYRRLEDQIKDEKGRDHEHHAEQRHHIGDAYVFSLFRTHIGGDPDIEDLVYLTDNRLDRGHDGASPVMTFGNEVIILLFESPTQLTF